MPDYATLRLIWWLLLGIILIGFAVTEGFDMGMGILLPFITRTNNERRIAINTVGPVWEGNQVWFILAGGAVFAAWPYLYAVSFSGFYLAMLLVLAALILRPVSFKYRSKVDSPIWRRAWDCGHFIGGLVPALVFGVAIGNILQGAPFHFNESLRSFYTGSFFDLFSPFALLCGVVSVAMFAMQGGFYLSVKTEDPVRSRAITAARIAGLIVIVLFAVGGYWIAYGIKGFELQHFTAFAGPSNPLHKVVTIQVGAWLDNYKKYDWMMLAPIFGFAGALLAIITAKLGKGRFAFCCSSLSLAGIVTTFGVSMFPFLFPSSTNPNQSLVIWDASSSRTTLFIMLIAACIFIPIILAYTSWVYRVMRGKVTTQSITENKASY